MKLKLNKNQIERFSRQIVLKDIGILGQKKIIQSKVLIVGMGGLGCPAAEFLTRAGIGSLGIIDSDIVDLSNIHRQSLYDISDLEKLCINIRNISEKNTKVILQMSIKYHLLCLIYSTYMKIIRILKKYKLRKRNFIFTNFYSFKELNKIMNSHGFILERKRKFGFDIPGFTSNKYLTNVVKFLLPIDHLLGTDMCLVYKLKKFK